MKIADLPKKLFPQKTQFYDLLEESTRNLSNAVQLLTALAEQDAGEERDNNISRIQELEHNGDRITHRIYRELSKTFITPIDAEDIYALASALDDVMDHIEGIATRIRLYKIATLPSSFHAMISILSKAIEVLSSIIPQLRGLSKASSVIDSCVEIRTLEHEADKIYRETIADLFSGHDGLLENLKLKEVITGLEWAMDSCQRLANRVEHVVLKYS
jgi:predicted phosphate transport protein (TIGR00153 family)